MTAITVIVIVEGRRSSRVGEMTALTTQKKCCVKISDMACPPDNDLEFECEPGSTLRDLKVKFEEEEGIGVSRQTYFCGLYLLEDDSVLLTDLMIDNSIRLNVKLPKAGKGGNAGKGGREIWAEKETWLITGSRNNFDPPMMIPQRRLERILVPKGKFGVVTLTVGEGPGARYQVRRYQEDRKGHLELRREGGETEVYIILEEGTNGEEEKLKGTMMIYDETRNRTGMETATGVASIAGQIAKITKAIAGLVFEGRWSNIAVLYLVLLQESKLQRPVNEVDRHRDCDETALDPRYAAFKHRKLTIS